MGYRNDQFYNATEYIGTTFTNVSQGRTRRNYVHYDADNPRFIYPDRSVRTYTREGDELVENRTVLKRGFIRSMARTAGEPIRKCQFQFNPQVITQDVSMSESVLNFFQQDPGQYAQPMAGNTMMSFTLLFDRTMEINNASGTERGSIHQIPNSRNPWESGDPQYVGVLRDISALYGVIGQGVAEADIQSRLDEISTTIRSETLSNPVDSEDEAASAQKIQDVLSANLGNYTLLVPRPVRMVLSSLYIVEGFVQSTSVTFTKFNTAFVPIQATVNLTFQAMHIGHLRDETFLTYSLREAEKAAIEVKKAEVEARRELYAEVQDELKSWYVRPRLPGDGASFSLWDLVNGEGASVSKYYTEVLATRGPALAVVKSYMDDGATLDVTLRMKVHSNLPANTRPGYEGSSPQLEDQYSWTITTRDGVEFHEGQGGGRGGQFFTDTRSARQFTQPGTDPFGPTNRATYELTVRFTHNGNIVRGHKVEHLEIGANQTAWEKDLEASFDLNFAYHGDLQGVNTTTPSTTNTTGAPSGVGS